jgi:hypothetical protein
MIFASMAALRREVADMVEAAVARIFVSTLFAKSSEIGNADAVQSSDENDPGQEQPGQRPVSRVEPFGFRSRPTSKVRGLALRLGRSNVLFLGILPTEGYGPQDLKDGETSLYSAAVERGVHLDEDGNNNINAADSKDVVVNGGTKQVARVDDTLTASAKLTIWAKAVEDALSAASSPILPASSWDTLANGAAGALGDIETGAEHFKG